ncbi:MAG: hypothetical protein LUE90_08600 [Clostridiales bacterium]|nr:hypothetical protein [Clostridiales bacterium]
MRMLSGFVSYVSHYAAHAKALQCVRARASFTVEAAFVLPVFLFAAVVVIGVFPVISLQAQVNAGLQYAARMTAVSFQDSEDDHEVISLAEAEVLFRTYMREHGYEESVLPTGLIGVSLLSSDLSDDYVTLVATYEAQLPVSFWRFDSLPVKQCVSMKKWTGDIGGTEDGEDEYVYITPEGAAYHKSAECSYLKLSVRSVSVAALDTLRNRSGGIYYACSCYQGSTMAYITDYGTQYHGDLSCSGLKRTIYRVRADQAGDRHACSKCCP